MEVDPVVSELKRGGCGELLFYFKEQSTLRNKIFLFYYFTLRNKDYMRQDGLDHL